MLADVTPMFPRARDPHVFPASVSQYSVIIPKDADPALGGAGLFLPAALEGAAPKRKIQFFAGRFCAREAIERLGPLSNGGALPRDSDGCPVWPEGLVGSISHTDASATAAVARSAEARGLGVDVESVMSGEAADEVARLVASEDETQRAVASRRPEPAGEPDVALFGQGEPVQGALSFVAAAFRLSRLRGRSHRSRQAAFAIRMRTPFDAAFGAAVFMGRYELTNGEVRTGVLVSEKPPG